jgi:hypothetical protein
MLKKHRNTLLLKRILHLIYITASIKQLNEFGEARGVEGTITILSRKKKTFPNGL